LFAVLGICEKLNEATRCGKESICVCSEICQYPAHGSGAKAAERVESV
jgi:hypothetical protein